MALPGIIAGAVARAGAKKLAEKGGKKMSKAQAEKLEFEEAKDTLGKTAAGAALGSAGAVAYDTYENPTKSGLGMRPEVAERKQKEREAENEMKRETRGMKKGGKVHDDVKKDKPMMEKVAKKAVKGHEARMHKTKKMMGGGMTYKKGGSIDGCATKGKTKGKQVKMASGGKC